MATIITCLATGMLCVIILLFLLILHMLFIPAKSLNYCLCLYFLWVGQSRFVFPTCIVKPFTVADPCNQRHNELLCMYFIRFVFNYFIDCMRTQLCCQSLIYIYKLFFGYFVKIAPSLAHKHITFSRWYHPLVPMMKKTVFSENNNI